MTTEFEHKDIPVSLDWQLESKADKLSGEIELVTKVADRVQRELVETKSQHVMDRLKELGWVPPNPPSIHLSKEIRNQYGPAIKDLVWQEHRIIDLNRSDLLVIISYLGSAVKNLLRERDEQNKENRQ